MSVGCAGDRRGEGMAKYLTERCGRDPPTLVLFIDKTNEIRSVYPESSRRLQFVPREETEGAWRAYTSWRHSPETLHRLPGPSSSTSSFTGHPTFPPPRGFKNEIRKVALRSSISGLLCFRANSA